MSNRLVEIIQKKKEAEKAALEFLDSANGYFFMSTAAAIPSVLFFYFVFPGLVR